MMLSRCGGAAGYRDIVDADPLVVSAGVRRHDTDLNIRLVIGGGRQRQIKRRHLGRCSRSRRIEDVATRNRCEITGRSDSILDIDLLDRIIGRSIEITDVACEVNITLSG